MLCSVRCIELLLTHAVQVAGVHRPAEEFELLQFVGDGDEAREFAGPGTDLAFSQPSTVASAEGSQPHPPPAAGLPPGPADQAVTRADQAVTHSQPEPVVIELSPPPGPDPEPEVALDNSSALLAPAPGLVPLGLPAVAHSSPLISAHNTSAAACGPDPFGRVRTEGRHSGGFALGVESALSGSAQLAAGVVDCEFWVCVLCDGADSLANALVKESKANTRKRGTNIQGRRQSCKERTASSCPEQAPKQAQVTDTTPVPDDGRKRWHASECYRMHEHAKSQGHCKAVHHAMMLQERYVAATSGCKFKSVRRDGTYMATIDGTVDIPKSS